MIKRFSVEDLAEDLHRLGVCKGDTLYVRARASAVGRTTVSDALFLSLTRAVGSDGTVVFPAFTGYGSRWGKNKKAFSLQTSSQSGALSKLALQNPSALRSSHPSHSFVAIGPNAGKILSGHDHTKPAFHPVRSMINLNAKMLLIGCNTESPGFSTVHYAQEQLGLSHGHLTKYFRSVQIVVDGGNIDWHPTEDPGCSKGFDKLYRHYIHEEILKAGSIGNAYSLLADSEQLYRVDREVLSMDPLAVLCDDGTCMSCRGLRSYNLSAMPLTIARRAFKTLTLRWKLLALSDSAGKSDAA